jgi:DNA-directed RNA polymerase sigma subunit (sigma70/sigma32)
MNHPQKYVAMTFEEIAQRLGVTRVAVRQSYISAMEKIRRNPRLMEQLRSVVAQHERSKPHERVYPDWVRE